jgi:rhodanese-related sulfurtransferase
MKIKFTLLLILSFFISYVSAEELTNLSTQQLISMQKEQKAIVIDIRTEKEWSSTGTISESHKLQFFTSDGKYDLDKWLANLKKLKQSEDQPVILVCRSGNRSSMVGTMLTKQLNLKNIYHLSSGISSWIKAGNKVIK